MHVFQCSLGECAETQTSAWKPVARTLETRLISNMAVIRWLIELALAMPKLEQTFSERRRLSRHEDGAGGTDCGPAILTYYQVPTSRYIDLRFVIHSLVLDMAYVCLGSECRRG